MLTGIGEAMQQRAERDRLEARDAQRRREEDERYRREQAARDRDREQMRRLEDELYQLRREMERQRAKEPAPPRRNASEYLDEEAPAELVRRPRFADYGVLVEEEAEPPVRPRARAWSDDDGFVPLATPVEE